MIQDFLSATASRTPKHPALVSGNIETTYEELKRLADSVSAHLQNFGIRRGDKVVLLFDNGPEYAALFFGILNAGGVVVPLNPTNIEDSVRYIAGHCAAKFVAATERALPLVMSWWNGLPVLTDSASDDRCILLEDVFERQITGLGQDRHLDSGDLAILLYTSGTTGIPKGVMLSHGNLEANTRSILKYLPLEKSDRTLVVLPFYYSYGNSLLLTHMAAGATLVVENGFAFVMKAINNMKIQGVTGFSGVPSHFAILINRSRFLEIEWPKLRYLTCAGGALPISHIKKIRQSLPGVSLHLMYGQTEGSARLSSLHPSLVEKMIGSIGCGIPGVELRVVNEHGKNVQLGEVGEIIARGDNIMLGYFGDPQATQKVLKGGWLYTGDLATVKEGFLYIVGRSKEMIKSGGYRISPYQIEDLILQHPLIIECAVVGVTDEIQGEKIMAYVVSRDGCLEQDDMESIMIDLREKLPNYMVPSRIEHVESLPKTDSGKIKRVELSGKAPLSSYPLSMGIRRNN